MYALSKVALEMKQTNWAQQSVVLVYRTGFGQNQSSYLVAVTNRQT
jgi:hypothetical protein